MLLSSIQRMRLPSKLCLIVVLICSLFLPSAIFAQDSTHTIYADSLSGNWQNWSWGAVVDTSAEVDGTRAISFRPWQSWSALYLHSQTDLPANAADTLEFSVRNGGSAKLRVFASGSDWQQRSSVAAADYQSGSNGEWQHYTIPYEVLAQGSAINGIFIQETSGSVVSAYSIDNLALQKKGQKPTSLPSPSLLPTQLPLPSVSPSPTVAPSSVVSPVSPVGTKVTQEFQAAHIPSWAGSEFVDSSASKENALLMWSGSTATFTLSSGSVQSISLRLKGDQCQGSPQLDLVVDSQPVRTLSLSNLTWQDYNVSIQLAAGTHTYSLVFTNDFMGSGCDRNVRLDTLVLATSSASAPTPAPTPTTQTNGSLFLDTQTPAQQQYETWKNSQPTQAEQIKKIAEQPTAKWFGGWSGNVQNAVSEYLARVPADKTAVLVAYNIPWRDCSGYSVGGANSTEGYKEWIQGFANGIQGKKTMVILEPDALSLTTCLTAQQLQERSQALSFATQTLKAAGAQVYLDAGHSQWMAADSMAQRLQAAGVAQADGFSLNVSNYNTTEVETAYGQQLSGLVGGKPFVIDTSRNGSGSNGEWCNPSGRSLGLRPTLQTGKDKVAAYLWTKYPGESDGSCNGGPSAGTWWPEYALGLATVSR